MCPISHIRRLSCAIRFAQYGKITKVTKTEKMTVSGFRGKMIMPKYFQMFCTTHAASS
jgi:hypothetical protein